MNKQVKSIVAVAAVVSMALGAASVNAGAKESNLDTENKSGAENSAISQAALAAQLISYGDKNKDPMALILAAKIKKQNPSKEVKKEKSSSEGGKNSTKAKKADGNAVAAVLKRARKLSGKNAGLLAMVKNVESMKSRGYVGNMTNWRGKVNARATDTWKLTFEGGRRAEILVVGDHDTDLDLYVYDKYGNLGCSDTDSSDTMYCRFYPRKTSQFTVRIKNRGRVYNRYKVTTN